MKSVDLWALHRDAESAMHDPFRMALLAASFAATGMTNQAALERAHLLLHEATDALNAEMKRTIERAFIDSATLKEACIRLGYKEKTTLIYLNNAMASVRPELSKRGITCEEIIAKAKKGEPSIPHLVLSVALEHKNLRLSEAQKLRAAGKKRA